MRHTTIGGRRIWLGYFAIFLLLNLLITYLNRHHTEQQTNFIAQYVPMANYYAGRAERSLLTYPTWGYPFALLLVPEYNLIVLPQAVLAAIAITALYFSLRNECMAGRGLLTVLFVAAVPWYALHSVKWPLSFAASLITLALLFLARGIRKASLMWGSLAGSAMGLSLYFRSEFLYLPILLCFGGIAAVVLRKARATVLRPLAAFALVAWLLLVPWAIHFHNQTGRYSLTASQKGIVAFISLGQLPNNPWGAAYEDEYAIDYLRRRGITLPAQSDSADRVLFEEYKHRIRQHPTAFAKKAVWNGVLTLTSGFYNPELQLSDHQAADLSVLKENIKKGVGHGFGSVTNSQVIAAVADQAALISLGYWVIMKAIGSLFILLSVAGLSYTIVRRRMSPLLAVLGTFVTYQGLLLVLLTTEPRYLNGLYIHLIPFFVVGWVSLRSLFRRRSEPSETKVGGKLVTVPS